MAFAGSGKADDGRCESLGGGSFTPWLRKAWQAVSKAIPIRRVVSGSNLWLPRYCLIGIARKI